LKVVPAVIFATVLIPLWIANSSKSKSKSTNDNLTSMDDAVKSPAEDAQVVPGGANGYRVIRGVTVILIQHCNCLHNVVGYLAR
jgi:hypothetical protein